MTPGVLTADKNDFTINSKQQTVCLILVYKQLHLWSLPNLLSELLLRQAAWKVKTYCIKTEHTWALQASLTLTEVIGDVIRNVDLPISPLAPHAALAGAGVCVFLGLTVDGDVSSGQDGIIDGADWNTSYRNLNTRGTATNRRTAAAHTHSDYCWLSPEVQRQKAPLSSPLQCPLLSDINKSIISLCIKIHQSQHCAHQYNRSDD